MLGLLPVHSHALVIGYQEILPAARETFPFFSVGALFRSWEWETMEVDLHDPRGTALDLNKPIQFRRDFDLVFDIGTLEHIADSQQAIENYLGALRADGLLFLLTPVKGYFDHGFHVFSPEYLRSTLTLNGCAIIDEFFL